MVNNKIRLIQCGVGGHGVGWVHRYASQSPDFELVAECGLHVGCTGRPGQPGFMTKPHDRTHSMDLWQRLQNEFGDAVAP